MKKYSKYALTFSVKKVSVINITIVGMGNIGTQFAVHCAEKKHNVTVYGSKPEKISSHLTIIDENGSVIHSGDIVSSTRNEKTAFENADVIFITVPAYCMKNIAEKILPYAKKGLKIGLIPGTGGGECAFSQCMKHGTVIFGLQRVPSVARLVKYGETVRAVGYRKTLYTAALPSSYSKWCSELVSELFDIPCIDMPNYLNVTLTPSNPILHTTRLRCIFKDYQNGKLYDNVPLFYEDWNNESSDLLIKCDNEVQEICSKLKEFDLRYVKSLKDHYESYTAEEMTEKISGIKGFKKIETPTVKVDGKYKPDLNSRYFTSDFKYGLSILVQIADFVGCKAPAMRDTLLWYEKIEQNQKQFCYNDYNINSISDFINFYKQ